MPNRSGLFILFAIAGAVACGGPSDTEFFDPTAAAGKGGSSTGGKGGAAGSMTTGGKGGSSTGGKGGAGTSGSSSTTGGGGGKGGSSGSAGDAMGGTGTETGGTGGTAGGAEVGGAAGTTGGTGMETGGASGTTGGTGTETGGTGAMGGMETGGVGGAGGTKAGAGGSAGSATDPDCEELTQAYAAALEEARVCNADSGKDQCTQAVTSNLTCGCAVFVNPDNEEAIAKLETLRKQAGTRCAVVCPAIACIEPESGTCLPNDANKEGGSCGTGLATTN